MSVTTLTCAQPVFLITPLLNSEMKLASVMFCCLLSANRWSLVCEAVRMLVHSGRKGEAAEHVRRTAMLMHHSGPTWQVRKVQT